ncbi:flagellar basal body-associated FliL family protein [Saccharospirillum alexandrii]|uniref:flagellar basal body-associated FliL family protein n=1 Tax=Saccharospirillum alexandrii TaxID=2448477 RepID=UPI000FD9F3D0|nr:flagellar basal body-associated FliL family protein [Saccharospirillum alexandrii]
MLPLSHIVKPFHLLSLAGMLCFCLSLPAGAEDAVATGPTYVELEPSFTINYGEGSRLRYLQASISLLVPDGKAALEVSTHSDAIRHEIIMLISAQDRETLTSTTGRSELQTQLLEQIQGYMEQETGAPQVDRVLFTAFVIQG